MTQPPSYPGSPEPPEEPDGSTPPPIPPQQPPAYGSPYGAPQPPPYGAPQQPPAYGGPQQPPYGYGSYPTGPTGHEQPSKGMAIAALVLAFFACTFVAGLVSLVLAVLVLVRGRDGRNHGKGLAITAIVVNVVVMAVTVLAIVGIAIFAEEQSIDNLETGECFNADDLANADADRIGLIDKVDCDEPHDGQVVGTADLTSQQATAYPRQGFDCATAVDPGLLQTLDPATYLVFGLTQDERPASGDAVACVAVNSDGSKLTEKLG